ncbi:deoxyribose-phosphate aldolase [Heliorestis convoluta]|uniref:Deoxyribose-phosphate aldolase n=1 Tax=Heliorestis convoluta TaxID=356322 RepID=A0A5Q2N229_9FIRM|nr:deoxyribose-phosphate aldolase [Heliorestis convoluta]QGG47889.1 deoxyribose-phosphate aldolase [Heliorestis convoluta]
MKDWQSIARHIDHTLLKAEAEEKEIRKLCAEATRYSFASVCVNPLWVEEARHILREGPVKVATVIAFPLGATWSTLKALEAREVILRGAQELDMVMNIAWAKEGRWEKLQEDIEAVVLEGKAFQNISVKVILETAFLTPQEIEEACRRAMAAGADYVKTSTGFGPAGATVENVALMKNIVSRQGKVKASGGIRSAQDAITMLEAGADRLGTSASLKIMNDLGAPTL